MSNDITLQKIDNGKSFSWGEDEEYGFKLEDKEGTASKRHYMGDNVWVEELHIHYNNQRDTVRVLFDIL